MEKIDILGMMLGDGCVTKNGTLAISHSIKQKQYCEFKYNKIKEIYSKSRMQMKDIISNKMDACRFYISDVPFLKKWREKLYSNDGKKHYTREVLECLTKRAIAFWYCDDGSMYYKKKRNGRISSIESVIATCCSIEEIEILIEYFSNKWGIKMTKKREKKGKYFSLRFGTSESKKFIDLFGEFIPECMKYKKEKIETFYLFNKKIQSNSSTPK